MSLNAARKPYARLRNCTNLESVCLVLMPCHLADDFTILRGLLFLNPLGSWLRPFIIEFLFCLDSFTNN